MTTPHRTLQMALDALDAITDDVDGTGLNTMPSFDKAIDAIAALREALAAPEPEPVALESVHLTRDTRGMCVVRVNGRVAIRDNGDIIDHMATLEWFAAPPAAPDSQWMPIETAPKDVTILLYGAKRLEMCVGMHHSRDGWVTDTTSEWMSMYPPTHWMPLPAAPDHLRDVAKKVAPAAPVPDALAEAVAKAIYWEWRRDAGYVPWVDGGNSLKQDDARKIARAVVSSAAPVVREPRHVRKVGGSFQHTGAVVAEFKTLAGEPRIVLEFDAPVAGMLHVYRPDQVEPCEPAAPAAPVVREPLRDDAFHAWVEEASADHPNMLERQEFRDAMYNAWINGYNTRVDEQAHGITGGSNG